MAENFLRPIDDVEGILECFEEHGAVGVTGVLTPAECKALIKEGIEPFLPEGCKVDDPSTYILADSGSFNRYGVIGKEPLFSPALLKARLHPRVVAAFQAVYGDVPLIACHDRAAWMRPTEDNPAFAVHSDFPGLHLDISPTSYFGAAHCPAVNTFLEGLDYSKRGDFTAENNCKHVSQGRCVQAVLNLVDNAEEDGGFQFLPGAHGNALQEWVEAQERNNAKWAPPEPNGRYVFSQQSKADTQLVARHGGAVRLPSPAGTLILFDAALPHGTRPNRSANSRLILFLRYITPPHLPAKAWRQRNAALKRIAAAVGFEPDGREAQHLFGPA